MNIDIDENGNTVGLFRAPRPGPAEALLCLAGQDQKRQQGV